MRARRLVDPWFVLNLDDSGPYPITLGLQAAVNLPVRVTRNEARALRDALTEFLTVTDV